MGLKASPRSMFFTAASPFPMLRGPQVFYAPDEDEGGGTPEEFQEQPGDREPEPEAPEPEPAPEEPEPAEEEAPPAAEAAEGDPDPEEEPPKRKTDWRDRQVIKKNQQLQQERDARIAAEKKATVYEALYGKPEGEAEAPEREDGRRAYTADEFNQAVAARARVQTLNDRCEAMFDAGAKTHKGDWQDKVNELGQAFGEQLVQRLDFFETLTDLPNGADVYHHLAGDLDEVESLLSLPPHKLGVKLAALSGELKAKNTAPAPKPVSKAPPPIKPIDARGGERDLQELLNDPNASMEEIDRRMRKAEEQRYNQRH